ncbi:MAG: hypothetical protein JXQ72_00140 [Anaerolineae bacterium]|nr:hypothetical protein [Anaerolineae bacterium]
MNVESVTLVALGLSLVSIGVAAAGVVHCLRRQPPIPPGSPDSPEHPSGPFGWHICPRMKVWFGLLTAGVLVLILAVGVLVMNVAEDETKINIVSHQPGDTVAQVELVRGTSKNLDADESVWLVVCPRDTHEYYPQAQVYRIEPGGEWSTYALIGTADESERAYDLLAVLAGPDANAVFAAHQSDANTGMLADPLDDLPDGARVYDRISVVR